MRLDPDRMTAALIDLEQKLIECERKIALQQRRIDALEKFARDIKKGGAK